MDFRSEFIAFAIENNVLRFGEFTTKAGRQSPYFFNAGLFDDGAKLLRLSHFYAKAAITAPLQFDMLFGPAYKGIPLVAGLCMALSEKGHNFSFAYNRKEVKDHGEGGRLVGKVKGRVLIIDDVISAGTSVRESVSLIREAGAEPAGVLIALDRQERGQGVLSAKQEVMENYGIPVFSIATLDDLIRVIEKSPDYATFLPALENYRTTYGVAETISAT